MARGCVTSPPLQKPARKGGNRSLDRAVRRTAAAVSAIHHNLPGSCKTKYRSSGPQRSSLPQGAFRRKTGSLLPLGAGPGIQAVLVMVSQRVGNLHLCCC